MKTLLRIALLSVVLCCASCALTRSTPEARAALARKPIMQVALYPVGNAPGMNFADLSNEGATLDSGGGGAAPCPT